MGHKRRAQLTSVGEPVNNNSALALSALSVTAATGFLTREVAQLLRCLNKGAKDFISDQNPFKYPPSLSELIAFLVATTK